MAELTKKQYLDLAGLKAFWGIIKDKFVSGVTLNVSETGAAFTATYGDGETKSIGAIPIASENGAGLMSAAQAKTVDEFSEGVAALVPFTDLKIGTNKDEEGKDASSVTLKDRAAHIDFKYDSDNRKINVVDLNNNSAVLTSIDATAFIKDGMIDSVSFDTEDNPNDLVITFNTDAGKEAIILPLDKLVDVYTGTNGVKVDGNVISVVTNGDYLVADAAGLKVADALWDKVGELDEAVATAAAADAEGKANTAKTEAIAEAGKLANAAQAAAIGEATTLASTAESNAKKYTDDRLGNLGKVGEGEDAADHTVKTYVDAAVEAAKGSANEYVDELVGELPEGSDTVVDAINAAQTAAQGYADGLNNAMNTRVEALEDDTHKHDNKTVLDGITTEKVAAWDAAEDNANTYTTTLIGGALAGEGTGTVKGYVDTAIAGANTYADTAAQNVYALIEAIPVSDIDTADKLDALA